MKLLPPRLDPHSGVPLYRQLADYFQHCILARHLAPNDQLPSVRDLAAELNINPLTVQKAFAHLERRGLIELRRGLGTFVAAAAPQLSPAERRARLAPLIDRLLDEACHLKVTPRQLIELIHERINTASDTRPDAARAS